MRRYPTSIIVWLVLGTSGWYAVHLINNYLKIQKDFHEKEALSITPHTDDQSVEETGYVYSMRRDTNIREGDLNLVWFIVVPSTNSRWSCSYQSGFSKFKVGDSVKLIREKNADETSYYSGYIVGLYGSEKNKAANAWVLDLDELEMEMDD